MAKFQKNKEYQSKSVDGHWVYVAEDTEHVFMRKTESDLIKFFDHDIEWLLCPPSFQARMNSFYKELQGQSDRGMVHRVKSLLGKHKLDLKDTQ